MLNEEDKKEIKKIIADELSWFIKIDRLVLNKDIQILNYKNIQLGRTNGTVIATEGGTTGQKLGFWNTTPITQPSKISDPAGGGNQDTEARAAINAIIDLLQNVGFMQT